jgi:hypothetical protein
MEEFLQGQHSDDIVTPESLAWKLLMDDDIKDFVGVILPYVVNDDAKNNTNYDNLASQFEILITMYMEMLFGTLKIQHVNAMLNEDQELDPELDLEETFQPNISKFSIDEMINLFREKLKKIRIFLSVRQIVDSDETNSRDFGSEANYYCRVLLKDTPDGKTYFWNNRNRIEPTKRYTFVIRNDENPTQKKLDDFYAVATLPGMKIRISFSPINVIVQNPHPIT